jgi:FtsP/CotA-like multicopper oxidase with cupredoxin domain
VLAPNAQDRARPGVKPLEAGATEGVAFALTPGTHWMHSHSLTEQQLLAAPMVAREKDAGDVQDVVVMLHDFSFRTPEEILAGLGGSSAHGTHGRGTGAPRSTDMRPQMHGGHRMGMGMTHANDVAYDAYLANDRTLQDPEVVRVDGGNSVRVRIINGGTATAFFISTGLLKSRCIAVDGSPCKPTQAAAYPLAQGQRIDLLLDIPPEGGAFPVLAQVEADRRRTGVIFATAGASVNRIEEMAAQATPYTGLSFETSLRAARPLPQRRPNRSYILMLGEAPGYQWFINGRMHGEHEAFEARSGERVEMTFMNPTSMMHPMHLHGHHFQVVGIGGRRFAGPMRDTVIVPSHIPVTIAFDAALKGNWFLHCHHLYHMATGMMTELRVA